MRSFKLTINFPFFDEIAKKAKIYLSPEKIEEYGHKILANMAEFYKYWSQEGLQVVEAWNQALQQTAVNINVYLKECLKEPALRLSDGPLDPTEILHFVPQLIVTFVTGLILQNTIKENLSSDKKDNKSSNAGIAHSATGMPHDPDNEPDWRKKPKEQQKDQKEFEVDKKDVEKVYKHDRYGKFYKMKDSREFYTKEVSGDRGHGGCRWKVYEKEGQTMKWLRDLNKYGQQIDKHKGPVGREFPWKDLHG